MSFRIIHVEDSPIQMTLTERILAKSFNDKEDYVYKCVGTLKEAINLLDGGCLDIILVDLGLPDNNGQNPVEVIKAICPQTPIVILTANDDVETAKACVRAGADAYLLKANVSTLPLIIIMAVERWELRKEQQHISAMYRSIVEESPDWIVRFNPKGEITFANNAAITGMGETFETVIGKSIDNYLDGEQNVTHEETISRITPHNPHVQGRDMWLNGHLIQWRKSGIFDSRNRLIEIQAIGKDVTDQHFMMERLLKNVEKMAIDNTTNTNRLVDDAMETMKKTFKKLDEAEVYDGRRD